MNRIGKVSILLLIAVFFLSSASLMKTAFADVPTVDGVIVWNSGGDIILNVTVTHNDRSVSHYVDKIEVSYTVQQLNISTSLLNLQHLLLSYATLAQSKTRLQPL